MVKKKNSGHLILKSIGISLLFLIGSAVVMIIIGWALFGTGSSSRSGSFTDASNNIPNGSGYVIAQTYGHDMTYGGNYNFGVVQVELHQQYNNQFGLHNLPYVYYVIKTKGGIHNGDRLIGFPSGDPAGMVGWHYMKINSSNGRKIKVYFHSPRYGYKNEAIRELSQEVE